ncbi:UNVERIFIED_ORG: hypothetical protein M2438_003735 [Methylobacterium sp. SuP10 SLI 274]|uniref:hypothetical protein n=1 Tax=Methylorubrum extorquens TaxID=408 RepID=UPI0020A1D741|nr:hypothetical protein [Methylorubrum extorquens]MDF9864990.1 hypothetical protein [Methylorubrum pseudosasae]MDH6638560.1 hypothetical protein [Methylobacterium sp. SuP10 SLI 274]MDH6667745.1 hypothetical protein [Methylorubrum zatmanii]MCP1559642.1 hypothetical protein [Methylorubrum extorquens]MDF9793283.1 hypothetical protein [Methylorubrum extorquens]
MGAYTRQHPLRLWRRENARDSPRSTDLDQGLVPETVPAKKIVAPDGFCEICLTLGAGRVLARIPRLADKPATQSVAGRAGLDGIRETTPPRRAAKERS